MPHSPHKSLPAPGAGDALSPAVPPVADPARSSTASDADIDLYCLTCGYNLRGLTGDPRRCPECGGLNPVGDVILPAAIITEQLRRMETAPALCLAAVLALAFFGGITVMVVGPLHPISGVVPCMVLLLALTAMVWGVGVDRFRVSCMSKPGWPAALLRYHVWGLGLMLVVFAPAVLLGVVIALLSPPYRRLAGLPVATLAATALAIIAARFRPPIVTGMYRRAREDLEVLQREVAVSLARERTRKALHRERR
jgi:hypothetical protein